MLYKLIAFFVTPVKANASMDRVELKVPAKDLASHLQNIRHISKGDKEAFRKSKENKASESEQTLSASKIELLGIKSRNKKWSIEQDQRPGAGNKGSRYTSNKTHYSPTDPDARISVKLGKARKLIYMSQLSVDIAHHVITDIKAYHADKKDNQYLQDITNRLHNRLWKHGLLWGNCVADTGYSGGDNYAFLEKKRLTRYILPHGTYKGCPDNFVYNKSEDHYLCSKSKIIPFKKVFYEKKNNTKKKEYRAYSKLCKGCELVESC